MPKRKKKYYYRKVKGRSVRVRCKMPSTSKKPTTKRKTPIKRKTTTKRKRTYKKKSDFERVVGKLQKGYKKTRKGYGKVKTKYQNIRNRKKIREEKKRAEDMKHSKTSSSLFKQVKGKKKTVEKQDNDLFTQSETGNYKTDGYKKA